MRNSVKFFFGLIFCTVNLAACKLDPPVFPKDMPMDSTGVAGATGTTGTTGVTGITDTSTTKSDFSGFWVSQQDKRETYTQTGELLSSVAADILYYGVTFSTNNNHASFESSPTDPQGIENADYSTTKIEDKIYIMFNTDPFFRSANKQIEIVSQTNNTMEWLIIDPRLYNLNGQYVYLADRLFLIKTH